MKSFCQEFHQFQFISVIAIQVELNIVPKNKKGVNISGSKTKTGGIYNS